MAIINFARGYAFEDTLIESPQPTFASLGVFTSPAGTPAALNRELQSIACERERNTAKNSVIINFSLGINIVLTLYERGAD